jgi:hypothetical protein
MTEKWSNLLLIRLHQAIFRLGYGFTHYRRPARRESARTIRHLLRSFPTVATGLECAELYQSVQAFEKIPGDLAEFGVYKGGTAAQMLSASRKRLHLFDSFEGLPHSENEFEQGEWRGSLDEVMRNLARWNDRIDYHSGWFPQSAKGLESLRFSFVHLDVDLYKSTLDALEWFWPRISPGGAVLSHDYLESPGVTQAFEEFFARRPEAVLPLSGDQCLAVRSTGD